MQQITLDFLNSAAITALVSTVDNRDLPEANINTIRCLIAINYALKEDNTTILRELGQHLRSDHGILLSQTCAENGLSMREAITQHVEILLVPPMELEEKMAALSWLFKPVTSIN